jgi:hypothetical protein
MHREFPNFDAKDFRNIFGEVNLSWLINVSSVYPDYVSKQNSGFFRTVGNSFRNLFKNKKGISTAQSRGFRVHLKALRIPRTMNFDFYRFTLEKYINSEKNMMLIPNEIKLLNIVGCVVKGLLLCRQLGLPHGNLSGSTIFKINKFNWQISPPLYSRNNLKTRIIRMDSLIGKQKKQVKKNHLRFLLPGVNKEDMFFRLEGTQVLNQLLKRINNNFRCGYKY